MCFKFISRIILIALNATFFYKVRACNKMAHEVKCLINLNNGLSYFRDLNFEGPNIFYNQGKCPGGK